MPSLLTWIRVLSLIILVWVILGFMGAMSGSSSGTVTSTARTAPASTYTTTAPPYGPHAGSTRCTWVAADGSTQDATGCRADCRAMCQPPLCPGVPKPQRVGCNIVCTTDAAAEDDCPGNCEIVCPDVTLGVDDCEDLACTWLCDDPPPASACDPPTGGFEAAYMTCTPACAYAPPAIGGGAPEAAEEEPSPA